jgi:hypothetical protein
MRSTNLTALNNSLNTILQNTNVNVGARATVPSACPPGTM